MDSNHGKRKEPEANLALLKACMVAIPKIQKSSDSKSTQIRALEKKVEKLGESTDAESEKQAKVIAAIKEDNRKLTMKNRELASEIRKLKKQAEESSSVATESDSELDAIIDGGN